MTTTPILVHCTHGCGTLVVPVYDLNSRDPFTLLTIATILKEAHDAQEHKTKKEQP